MVALSLDTVRDTAIVVVGGAVVVAIVLTWVLKAVLSKVLSIVVLGVLAAFVWSQRTSVQECADRVHATLAVDDGVETPAEPTCTFFGRDVTVDSPFG